MKIFKTILIIIFIGLLLFASWKGYGLYKNWEAKRFNEIEFLRHNDDLIIQKITELSIITTKVVNETAKVITTPKIDTNYESLKAQVIELKKNESANKDEIKKLKEQLSIQRQAFLKSDDTLLIKGTNDETYLLYRDTEGILQPASDNIEKIIEHKDISEVPITPEEIITKKTNWNIKAGGYYAFNSTYGVILSKGLINIKDYSLNISLLIPDFKDFKLIAGGDVSYEFRDNLELAVGYNTNKEFYGALRYSF